MSDWLFIVRLRVKLLAIEKLVTHRLFCENVTEAEYGDVIEKPTINAKFGNAVIKFATYNKDNHTFGAFVEWTNEQKPTAVGMYAVKAEVLGAQNYYGIYTNTVLFEISQQELLLANITTTPLEFTYQADTPQVPTVTVLDKFGNTLTEGNANDYKLRIFKLNGGQKVLVQPTNVIDAGTYVINITGRNNYKTTNDIEIAFTII